MRRYWMILMLPVAAGLVAMNHWNADQTANEKAVRRAVMDYVEGFYEVKPELLERGVSPQVKKMGYWRKEGEAEYQGPAHMTYDQARELAGNWNVDDRQGTDLKYEVEVFEVADKIACAKVTAKWGFDYFQLVKEEDGWKIHHVLWQSHPPETDATDR